MVLALPTYASNQTQSIFLMNLQVKNHLAFVQWERMQVGNSLESWIEIMEISDGENWISRAKIPISSYAYFERVQDYLYLFPMEEGKLMIYDVNDPDNPFLIQEIDLNYLNYNVMGILPKDFSSVFPFQLSPSVVNPYLVVYIYFHNEVTNPSSDYLFIDISDPANPQIGFTLYNYQAHLTNEHLSRYQIADIKTDRVYLNKQNNDAILGVEVGSPQVLYTLVEGNTWKGNNFFIDHHYLVYQNRQQELIILDISDFSNPSITAIIDDIGETFYLNHFDDSIYVFTMQDEEAYLMVYPLDGSNTPVQSAKIELMDYFDFGTITNALRKDNHLLIFSKDAAYYNQTTHLTIINLDQSDDPSIVTHYEIEDYNGVWPLYDNQCISNDTLFLTDYEEHTITMLNISDPSNPYIEKRLTHCEFGMDD